MKGLFMFAAGAVIALAPAAATETAPAGYSAAGMRAASALMHAGRVVPGTCTTEQFNARVNACINSQCTQYVGTSWFYTCINGCVAEARAYCGV